MVKTLKVILALIVLAFAVAAAAVTSGVYNVAADAPHWGATESLLAFTRDRSIKTRAADIQIPGDLDDPARIAEGAEHYNEMCTGCHLAPDQASSEVREDLYPKPPNLATHGIHDPREAFWVIKHGIKMTAMPAWGKSHDDDKIWDMVALLKVLPRINPEQWHTLTDNIGTSHGTNRSGVGADQAANAASSGAGQEP